MPFDKRRLIRRLRWPLALVAALICLYLVACAFFAFYGPRRLAQAVELAKAHGNDLGREMITSPTPRPEDNLASLPSWAKIYDRKARASFRLVEEPNKPKPASWISHKLWLTGEPLATDLSPQVREALDAIKPDLDELRATAWTRPHLQSPAPLDDKASPGDLQLPQFRHVRAYCLGLSAQALDDLRAGRNDRAFAGLRALARLATFSRREHTLVPQMADAAVFKNYYVPVAAEGLRIRAWTPEQLLWLRAFNHDLAFERGLHTAMLSEMAYGYQVYSHYRGQGFADVLRDFGNPQSRFSPLSLALLAIPRGFWDVNMAVQLKWQCRYLEAFRPNAGLHGRWDRAALLQHVRETDALAQRWRPFEILAAMSMPAYQKIQSTSAECDVWARVLGVACALEQHRQRTGEVPASLAELAAPAPEIAALPGLAYQRDADGYSLTVTADDKNVVYPPRPAAPQTP